MSLTDSLVLFRKAVFLAQKMASGVNFFRYVFAIREIRSTWGCPTVYPVQSLHTRA